MVLSRGLVISLGVSALGCTLLFLYFRNKISAIETKVDVMFDLIQNHQMSDQQQYMQHTEQKQMETREFEEETTNNNSGAWNNEVNSQPELINVSEDEEDEDDDDDDSDEVSDSDDEDEETPKLSLAKTEDMSLSLSDVKKITVQESDNFDMKNQELPEVEDVTDSLDEIDVDDDDDDEEDEEEETKEIPTLHIQKLDDEFDYNKLKVAELKALAKQKGLEGYKSLKKGPLVELLKSSE